MDGSQETINQNNMNDKKIQDANDKLNKALDKVQEEVGMKLKLMLDYRPGDIVPVLKWIEPTEKEE